MPGVVNCRKCLSFCIANVAIHGAHQRRRPFPLRSAKLLGFHTNPGLVERANRWRRLVIQVTCYLHDRMPKPSGTPRPPHLLAFVPPVAHQSKCSGVYSHDPHPATKADHMAREQREKQQQQRALDAAFLEYGSMLGARRRQASSMDSTPTASTAALYTMASWRPSDTEVYMLSELQRVLLLHHLSVAFRSHDAMDATALCVAQVLRRSAGGAGSAEASAGADGRVLQAFVQSHRGHFLWSLVPTDVMEWMDACLPLDVRDLCGDTLAEHLMRGGSKEQLGCVTGALERGVCIPPVRMREWPIELVASRCFLKYVMDHVPAEDAALGWQDNDGSTVTMDMVARSTVEPTAETLEVLRLWLQRWSASDVCAELQTTSGKTLAMALAACGSLEVQKLWLEKWSASDCCPALQDKYGSTVAITLAVHDSVHVQTLWLEKWSASDCCPGLQDKYGRTVAMILARYGSEEVQKLWLEKWSASDCCPGLQDKKGTSVAMILTQYGSEEVQKLWLEKWSPSD